MGRKGRHVDSPCETVRKPSACPEKVLDTGESDLPETVCPQPF